MSQIAENLQIVRERIARAENEAGVASGSVTLVAVSKTVDVPLIREAYNAGQRSFGENRIQEWRRKSAELPADIRWNIIGHLQTNKAKYIIGPENLLLQSLDRSELAFALQKLCEKENVELDALIQLNLSREDTKSGLYADELSAFLDQQENWPRIHMRGLMTIGPNTDDETALRRVFAEAKTIYDELSSKMPDFRYLSMGMTHDYELAIREGSNMVRIGTAVFGARDYAM